jgi:hypothetical protein
MTTTSGSPRATGDSGAKQDAPPVPEFGGEVSIGGGPGPRWLRWWYYLVYVWAIAYLVGAFVVDRLIDGDASYYSYYGIVLVFAAALTAWLVYIAWKKKPPEP